MAVYYMGDDGTFKKKKKKKESQSKGQVYVDDGNGNFTLKSDFEAESREKNLPGFKALESARLARLGVRTDLITERLYGDLLGQDDIAPVKETAKSTKTVSAEEEEELLAGMTPRQRLFHKQSGGFVDTSTSWSEKIATVSQMIVNGEDADYKETDKLLKQLKTRQKRYTQNDFNGGKEVAELQEYYNTLVIAKNKDILSKTKMDGTDRSVLEEMQLLAEMDSGDEKEKRKAAVFKKMEEVGIPKEDYALFTDDKNFSWGTFGKMLARSSEAGLNATWLGFAKTINLLTGQNKVTQEIVDFYQGNYDKYHNAAQLYKEQLGGGGGWQFATEAVEGTMGAVPDAIMAIATAGQSKTGTLATKAAYEAGNWLTKAGLTVEKMFRNPQYWTSFARTLGSDYDEAKANGASDTVAALGSTLSSLINAGIEIGGDGGSGIQGLPDDLLSGDKNKFWAWVMSTFEEGGEEGLQKFVNEIITKTMYNHDADILNPTEYAKEMALGTISGAALGGGQVVVQGGANAYNQYQANKLTDDEKAVLEKEVEKRIADQETDDKKLTSREKNAIREQVRQELEKGGISIATIEEVLGGDTYKQYQDAKAKESAVIKEFESLYKGDELMQEIEKFLENSETLKIKKQLSEEVMGKASGSRLAESYYELGRRKEKFTADLSKYDEKQRAIVQRAINSGVLNNTNRTHEFVDLVAKISADKGVLFDFINNEKLKGTSFAVEGKVVNGFKTEAGEVFLNANAAKSLNTVVGHEITHVLEGTDLYEGLQKVLFDYAKSRKSKSGKFDSEYMERLHDTRQLYKDVKGYEGVQGFDKIKKEVAADLVGDYLFTDPDFIRHLSTKNRNLAQKLYDEIKYMLKVATAGSKEARELERVKKAFEDAWRGEVKKTGENQHSISETTDGRRVAVVDNDILNTIDTSTWDKATKKKAQKAASAELKKFSDGFTINGIEFVGNKDTRDEYTRSNYTDALARKNKTAFLDKMRASAVLDDVIQVATGWKNDNELKHDRDDYIDFVRGNTLILSGDRGYRAVVLAGITEDGRAVFHDVVDIYPDSFEIKKAESSTAVLANESPNAILEDSVAPNVAQDGAKVKQYSLSDGDGAVDSAMTEDVYGREISKRDHAEVQFSLSHDADYMDKAIAKNNDSLAVESSIMEEAKALRERIAERMNAIKDKGLVSLPEDIEGNTYLANSSYDGSEENTTICPRSLASEAFVDAVSEYLGRPLSVEEQIYISQDLQDRSLTPECLYCYVATDRKAYRAFLGDYIEQRDAVLQKLGENPDADISRNGDLYKEFLNGRKDTNPMYSRFKMWADAYKNGKPMIEASHLANMNKLMGDLNSEFGAELRPQIVDAMKYAQSASWAKKRVNYVAYNGHILKWKQNRINKLNSHYGLRMYSFSDFHPAFVLENMQMITDASVRGLKMLGYTKDTDFVEIFAPSGMNINISTFGFNQGDNVFENNVIGAEWEKAKALREQYPNVGITFVATNDTIVNWALKQDWIDVVIPYHLVRTGEVVAEKLGYTNYTKESADTKGVDWTKGADKKYIASTEHNNDKDTYLAALKENHLKPRFERFLGDPNYMKLVNECRQPDSMSKPVQPVFNEDAAMKALAKLEANGYYQPIGGSVDRMYEIAAEVAEEMGKEIAPAQYSLSQDSEGNQLSAGQQEYFKDSQVRDELGRLLAVYHGTENGGFTIFDPSYSDDNSSLFFTDDPNLAATYSGNVLDQIDLPAPKNGIARKLEMGKTKGKGKSGLYKSFLNIKNPLVVDCKGNGWNNIPYGNKSAKTTITENGNVIQIERSIGNDVEKATFTKEELSNSIARYKETYDQLMAEVENWDDGTPEAKMAEAVDRLRNDPVIAFLSTKNNAEGVSGIVTRVRQTLSSWGENADVNGRSKIVQEAMWDDESQSIKQYNTRDIAAIAKAKKHDGVIFKNVYDAGASKVDDADYSNKTVYIAFNSNQVKSVDNKNPTADPDVRYSLSADSEGNQLSYEQEEYFKDSKMRDENGNLKVMYHGTQNGGHYAFDPEYSDDGISLFFVDSNEVAASYSGTSETFAPRSFKTVDDINAYFAEIRKSDYKVIEQDGQYALYDDDFEVATSESLDDLFEEFKDWEGVGYGSVNYKAYLNLKNPLVVDADGRDWHSLPAVSGDKTMYEYIKVVAVGDRGEVTIEYSMTGDSAPVTETVDLYKKFDDALADTLSNLAPGESVEGVYANPSTTRDYARYAKDNGYDGVIFKNIRDNGGYSNGREGASTVAIAFDSNQVKSVANGKPTSDPDIRYSLSAEADKSYIDAVNRGDTAVAHAMAYEAAKVAGYDRTMFHETDAENIHIFDITRGTHGGTDYQTPYGIFTKTSSKNIGLGSKQMELFVKAHNTLRVENRDDVVKKIPGFAKYYDQITEIDKKYDALANQYEDEEFAALEAWMEENPDADMDVIFPTSYIIEGKPADIDDANYLEVHKKRTDVMAEWSAKYDAVAVKAKEFITNYLRSNGYDSMYFVVDGGSRGRQTDSLIVLDENQVKSADPITYDDNGNVIPLSERFNPEKKDIRYSLSNEGDEHPVFGSYNVYGKDVAYEEDFAPVKENVAKASNQPVTEAVDQPVVSPAETAVETTETEQNVPIAENVPQTEADMFPDENVPETDSEFYERMDSLAEMDAPMERPVYNDGGQVDVIPITKKLSDDIRREVRSSLGLSNKQMADVRAIIEKYTNSEFPSREELFTELRDKFGTYTESYSDEMVTDAKTHLRTTGLYVDDFIKSEIADYADLMRRNRGRIRFSKNGVAVDTLYHEMNSLYPHLFPESIIAPTDQLMQMIDVANMESTTEYERDLSDSAIYDVADSIMRRVSEYRQTQKLIQANRSARDSFNGLMQDADSYVPPVDLNKILANRRNPIGTTAPVAPEAEIYDTEHKRGIVEGQQAMWQEPTDLEKAYSRIDRILESDKAALAYELEMKKKTVKDADSLRKLESDYRNKVAKLEYEAEAKKKTAETANQRKVKTEEYSTHMEDLVGDTTYWKDKKLGLSYKTNTLRRNLRDVVRDANGNRDIATADAIYDELQGSYNHNEAILKRESAQIKKPYADMKITSAEDAYIQMLGELRHNPDTTLTDDVVNEFYEKHKKQIDTYKVERAIEDARRTYDDLLLRVNAVLKEQGMKEIPYRKGYFPHFTEDKQGFLAKLFNWKAKNFDIPTDIAGLTEQFNPNRSWQSFNKQRKGDTTDYSFTKGMDSYVHGALDWIHHIEDIQKRRAFENHIRYVHSEKGVQERIDKIRNNNELDADEMQEQIDLVFAEAENPLNNFVTDLRAGTNTLAGKKSSLDRGMEEMVNRKVYSVMTNLSNRVTGNMVAGSVSSALTNFIPITQSWGQVSPVSSLRAMGDTIRSAVRDDGMIDKSDFLTNRLRAEDNLYKSGWDKFGEKATFLMEGIDSFTAQVVWRSKYLENISDGMSENAAIKNADQFAENVIAGRSRGNMPTIFDSKNPLIKTLTAFQLEVNNQYGYMFKDMPQDLRNDSVAKLVKGYATMFMGAYAYNALYSSLVGRDAAFDPISIIEDLLKDLGLFDDDDEEKEPEDIILNLAENVLEEVPFVGGLLGGGRVPISAALPYDSLPKAFSGTVTDIADGDWTNLTKEWLNPVYYLAMPLGGGQLKKTVEGLSMFSDEHPVSGSYTASGNLRFPVEDTIGNRIQAGLFGQYASKNAREYFDNEWAPLGEKQIQEYIDVEIPFKDYHEYREGLKGKDTLGEKVAYISGLDLPIAKKNILVNNQSSRKDPIDMTDYTEYSDWGEFDYAKKYPEKYEFLKANNISVDEYESFDEDTKNAYSWAYQNPEKFTLSKAVSSDLVVYKSYTSDLADIKADKDKDGKSISGSRKKKVVNYINGLNASYGEKIVLFKSEYPSDDTYNQEIIQYIESRTDFDFDDKRTVLEELGFTVKDDGTVTWN